MQAVKNRSKVLREEANSIRNTGNNDKTVKTPLKILLEEAQTNRINSKALRQDTYAIRTSSNNIRNQIKILKEDA